MQAVIPAAGEGTRLRPLTADRPKGLVEVAGRPILAHCFEQVCDLVKEIVVVVGYRGQQIVDRFGDSFRGVPLSYVWQDQREGLGHAVLQTEPVVDDDFLVVNGDNVFRAELDAMVERHREEGVDGTVLTREVSPAEAPQAGIVEVADGRVVGAVEKPDDPPSSLANAGCYTLPTAIFRACRDLDPGVEGEYQLTDAVDALCSAGFTIVPVPMEGWRINVNTPADVERASERLRRGG